MTNPGFIPPVDWDLKSDGEQNSQDLRTYSLQIESEIERLEAWESKAVSQFYFGAEETDSWDSHLCNSQIDRIFDIWLEERDRPRPFVRKEFGNFIENTTLPHDVILLYQSVINTCAQNTQSTSNLCWGEWNDELLEAAARYCASRWPDPRYRSVLRCALQPDGFVNVIREGTLARTRFWIKRILKGQFTASSREDLDGLIRISKAVLSRVRAAYTWEAPASFLGADDSEIVQWTYPLVCGIPAECSVSEKQLRKEWKTRQFELGESAHGWDNFEDFVDARKFLECSKWFCSEYQSRATPTAFDVDDECRAVGLRMIAISMREAERFGFPSIEMPNIQNENDSAEFIDKILRLTVAEMPLKGTLQAITSLKLSGTVNKSQSNVTALPEAQGRLQQTETGELRGKAGDETNSAAVPNAEPDPPSADNTAGSFEVQKEVVWIRGFGEAVLLKRSAGVDRLIEIVTSRQRRVSVWDLAKIGAEQEDAGSEPVDCENEGLVEHETLDNDADKHVLGADANPAVERAVGKLIAQKKDAQASGDLMEAKRLKEQIDATLEPFKKNLKVAAKTVSHSLRRTYQRLRKDKKGSLLAGHFERFVKRLHKESDFVYVPDEHAGKIHWRLK